jgi:hypothetical protein
MDGHDSMLLEVPDDFDSVQTALKLQREAYDRIIKFPNGFEVKIPIDQKIGYTIKGLTKCPVDLEEAGLTAIYNTLKEQRNLQLISTGGLPLQESQPRSSEVSGLIV